MLLFPNLAFIMRIQGGIWEWTHGRGETMSLWWWSISLKQLLIPQIPLFTDPCGGEACAHAPAGWSSDLAVHLETGD